MSISVHHARMEEWLAAYDGPLFDSCCTDPPYHLTSIVKRYGKQGSAATANPVYARAAKGFMGKEWDGGDIAFRPETWRAVFDKLKPGAHLVAFSGTRTFHRMVCAIEDAGFEIRDTICWHYGSGFPKSHSMRAIDRPELGTALKPATELICLARKPLSEKSIAANVLRWGTGALNIDGCRINPGEHVPGGGGLKGGATTRHEGWQRAAHLGNEKTEAHGHGRWPANLIHDGSDEVEGAFPDSNGQQGIVTGNEPSSPFANIYGDMPNRAGSAVPRGDGGSAARFFYSAKAGPLDRLGSAHATIKPVDLMRWLARLVTPPGGHVLEPFAGSGTTGIACMAEQMACTMIEMEADHVADIERKLALLNGNASGVLGQHLNARKQKPIETIGGLFA